MASALSVSLAGLSVTAVTDGSSRRARLLAPTLGDDTIRPTPDGLPTELHFSLEQWALL